MKITNTQIIVEFSKTLDNSKEDIQLLKYLQHIMNDPDIERDHLNDVSMAFILGRARERLGFDIVKGFLDESQGL